MQRALALAVVATAVVAGASLSQARTSAAPQAKPLRGLPAYTAGYARWPRINAKRIPPREADPHDGAKNVYASRKLGRGKTRYPAGTVIVKEAVRPGTKFVRLIAVMRKVRGFDRRNHDWQMIEWVRDRPGARFEEVARGQVCYSCHVGAKKNDYVFTKR